MKTHKFIVSVPKKDELRASDARREVRDAILHTNEYFGLRVAVKPMPRQAHLSSGRLVSEAQLLDWKNRVNTLAVLTRYADRRSVAIALKQEIADVLSGQQEGGTQ